MATGGFHFHGLSSTGKSTLLEIAASVWGFPIETWRTTDNALESVAEAHNDVLLSLDELSQFDPAKAAQTAYMLGNNEGKSRSNPSNTLQLRKKWRILFLSTGEITLSDLCQITGVKTKGGVDIRMMNVEADAGAGLGVFEELHGSRTAAEFADSMRDASRQYRGTAGPAFVGHLINDWDKSMQRVQHFRDQFINDHMPPQHSSGEIPRAFERLALVAAAGELATEAGITGWQPGEGMKAVATIAASWLASRTTGSSDMDRAVDQVRHVLETQASRFENADEELDDDGDVKKTRAPYNRLGFIDVDKGDKKETVYLVFPEAFRSELCKGHDPKRVAQELLKRGHLRKGSGTRLQVLKRVETMGSQKAFWFYAIKDSIFESGEQAENDDESAESKAA